MRWMLSMTLLTLACATPQPAWAGLDLAGTWYLNGDHDTPCKIILKGAGRLLFINEKGSRAWGAVRGDVVFIPDWGENGESLRGRIRGDRITWPDGSFWSRPSAALEGTWYLNGDRGSPCKIILKGAGRLLFINEKGSRAWGTVRGNVVLIPDWGENGEGLRGRIRGDRLVWPGGSYWSRPDTSLEGTWYLNGDRDSPCKIILKGAAGRALFINEKGSRARGLVRGDVVLIPDWGENGESLRGRIRGSRLVWPDGSYWSR